MPREDGDEVVSSSGLVLAGGKVDADAIVAAAQKARELGLDEDEGAELRTVRFELRRDLAKRLDKYLVDRIAFLSRTKLQQLIDKGGVRVNGREPKASTVLRAGDVVEVIVPAPPAKDIQPEDIPLEVMYEDAHLIVINKQDDIIVHPARSENTGTMLGALAHYFKHSSAVGGGLSSVGRDLARPGVVHRLDRHTSGCIVFAKTEEAHWKLGHSFEHRRVDKRYLAVVEGCVEPVVQVIELPIGPHPSREKGYREKQVVRHDELGKPAVTVVRVREWYGPAAAAARALLGAGVPAVAAPQPAQGWAPSREADAGRAKAKASRGAQVQGHTLVELELRTGRTHQIRVHLSENQWPIVGDDMYGGHEHVCADGTHITRQALHATVLGFDHPITGERMVFTAPLRGDLARLVHDLRLRGTLAPPEVPGATVDLSRVVAVRA